MIDSHQWARSRSLVRVVLPALALTALILGLLLIASPRSASAQTSPTADYRLQNKLSTSVGTAPALTDIGPGTNTFTTATVDGASRKVLRFPQGNGLKLFPTTGVVSSNAYTIVVLFELDSVSGFKRIIDFKNSASDKGLYVRNGDLVFYRPLSEGGAVSGTGAPIAPNTYVQVVLSRNSSGTVRGYVDGVPQFSFTDSSNDAVVDSNNTLRFFRDNDKTGSGVTTEHSAGSVARIRLYNTAFVDPDVVVLDRIEPTIFTVNSPPDAPDLDARDGKCDVSTTAGIQCTLRAAIGQANVTSGADTINFASGLPGTIPLNSSLGYLPIGNDPTAAHDLTINGPGARVLTVSGNNASRVFRIGSGANAIINGLSISGGNTRAFGGGIHNDGGTLTLNKSMVSGNTATAGFGGGIHNDGGTLTLNNSTVSGNQALVELTGATRNGGVGGGIHNHSGTLTLTNSTVSGNTAADNAGGISIFSGTATLTNTTVTNNSPGGISNSGTAILSNTIVAGNDTSFRPDVQGVFTSQGNNVVGQAPLLGPLQNNGGPTDTHALLSGSPAIDTGTNPFCPSADQRGVARLQDGDGNGTGVCDIGSFEVANAPPTITNLRPAPGSEIRDRTPLLAATVRDAKTNLAKSNIRLFVDGNRKTTFSYNASTDRLTYTSGRLSFGKHTVRIEANDLVHTTTRSWSFKVVT